MAEWFFTSDLHGQSDYYEQVLVLASTGGPAAVILGGDLAPHATGVDGLRRQRLFFEGFLVEFARRLREAAAGASLLLLMGNDDWAANHDVLERHDGDLWRVLHERVIEVGGVRVGGLSWVPITPFAIKDWERWDDGGDEDPAKLSGWVSEGESLRPFAFDPARREPTIAAALAALERLSDPRETLYVLHSPPRDTACDVTLRGTHVGSRATRRFVEERQPPLVLSGHIHESPRVSGAWRETIGRTVAVNPGQFGSRAVCGVWFDPEHPAGSLRHTTHA